MKLSKIQRRERAEARALKTRSPEEQLAWLDKQGHAAKKERAKLARRLYVESR